MKKVVVKRRTKVIFKGRRGSVIIRNRLSFVPMIRKHVFAGRAKREIVLYKG